MARAPLFKKTVFDNGLTLLTERHPEYRSLALGAWVKVGTRHEHPKDAGASHFLEHMLFKGTPDRTALEIARQVDRVGGDFNAFTARDHTCFHLLLLDRDASLGLEILSDVVLNSTFDAVELERERKVILQEIAMVDESPEEYAHDEYYLAVFGKHGLGRPILGSAKSIRSMKRADLMRFYQDHYRPDQMVLSLAGDIDHDWVKRKIKSLTGKHWPGRPKRVKPVDHPAVTGAPKVKPGRWWIERSETEQVHIIWGVEGIPYRSEDRFAAYLLNVYLGGGMSSELFQEIREKNGLAYTVYSSLTPFADTGVFSIYAGTSMSQVPLCLRLIEECVERLKRKLMTREELEMIKDNLKGTILLSSDSAESRMSSIAKNEMFLGKYYSPAEICDLVDRVTPEDIRRVAQTLLRADQRSILALGDKPTNAVRKKFEE